MNHSPSPDENSLEQTISLLHSIIESTNDGILVVDTKGQIVSFNQKFARLWRIPAEILSTREDSKVLDFVLDQIKQPEKFISKVRELYSRPNNESFDVLEFKDGRVFERYSKPHTTDGKCLGRVWSFRDVTKREMAINDLRSHQENLERQIQARTEEIRRAQVFVDSIIENIPDMIFVKEAKELRIVRLNKAGEQLLEFTCTELTGKNDYDLFPQIDADHFTAKDREVLRCGALLDTPEEVLKTKKGERILHTKKIPIYDSEGNPEYLLGIAEDITERKQAEMNRLRLMEERVSRAALEESLKLREDFISIASHELKTPLTSLSMQVQVIKRLVDRATITGVDSEKIKSMLVICMRQVDRFATLINDLLDTSRISARGLTVNRESTDLIKVITEVISRFKAELSKMGNSLELCIDATIEGHWDAARIDQMLVNLLSNAMKYGDGKPIKISTEVTPTTVRILVKDHGIGIAKADQHRIFDRFERVCSISSISGLGLGLYITRQIVEAHGGRITVESDLGQGSTFIVELPLKEEQLQESGQYAPIAARVEAEQRVLH